MPSLSTEPAFFSRSLALVAFAVALQGGCSSDPTPSPFLGPSTPTSSPPRPTRPDEPQGSGAKPTRASYDRTCTTIADCVLVSFAESPCDTCKCPNDAISADEKRRFFDEEQAFRDTCREAPKPCLADCAPLSARCVEGKCTVVATGTPFTEDAGADATPDAR
jgi:hypothetical protein